MSDSGEPDTPWLMTMGHLGATDPGAGLVVLSSERDPGATPSVVVPHKAQLWLFSSQQTDVANDRTLALPDLGDPTTYAHSASKGAWLSTVDLGGGYGDAVVALALEPTGSFFYQLAPTAAGWPMSVPQPLSLASGFRGPLVVADVDGDGASDVVFFSPTDGIKILWNAGNGGFDAAPATIGKDLLAACSVAPDQVRAVTALRSTAGKPRELLVVTDTHLLLVGRDPQKPEARSLTTVTCADKHFPLFTPGSTSVVAGDVDGDGVDDVVFGRPGLVEVFLGTPVIP